MYCLRCGGEMQSLGVEKLQLGQAGLLTGVWANINAGALEAEILICEQCGKLEFYAVDAPPGEIAQVECPRCHRLHDLDDPKCPFCKHRLTE
ncbi:hypothetical protein [Feifania hominis]|uniref:Uncharacterized protein n=1 Tax=Feifania hominis TaxID=2763660 RepID=A0A926DE52_9FIRM|nr:hypothetical protein [Feifania hominis]MBC8536948.1 hypothetical protein [Feifania hominis]